MSRPGAPPASAACRVRCQRPNTSAGAARSIRTALSARSPTVFPGTAPSPARRCPCAVVASTASSDWARCSTTSAIVQPSAADADIHCASSRPSRIFSSRSCSAPRSSKMLMAVLSHTTYPPVTLTLAGTNHDRRQRSEGGSGAGPSSLGRYWRGCAGWARWSRRREAVRLGAFLETAEQQRDHDQDQDDQDEPHEAAAGSGPPRAPPPARALIPVPVVEPPPADPEPAHDVRYAQARRNMRADPNYLSVRG